jgi:hypothetical protein
MGKKGCKVEKNAPQSVKYKLASWRSKKQQKIEGVELLNKATVAAFRRAFLRIRG